MALVNPFANPEQDSQLLVITNSSSEIAATEDISITTGQEEQEEALESHEVIELQAFSEKKPWIEGRIKLLEGMPAIEVFVGMDAIRASAQVVPGLPSRAVLEEWLAKHDSVDKETEIFDTVELEKLRQLTKAATHRNLSPADTDVIELTLATIFSLDKLLQLLRERSASLELLGTRLTWEEHRLAAWVERRQIIDELTQFITKRARWNISIYQNPAKDELPFSRRGSINSYASTGSDSSLNTSSAMFSRSARFKLAEMLSRDAAQFGSRVTALRHGRIASAGKALDKLIDISRTPVPEELLDEQDRLEEKGITELEQVGKFAMNLVMQWRKADEIHVETMKDQATAQNLLEEIETAKMHHPTQRQCNSFMLRADALLKRLSVRVNPVATPQFFPHPTHSLFEDQQYFNAQLAQELAAEIRTTIDLVNKASISAKQYQTMYEAVRRLDAALEDAIDTSGIFKTYIKQMEIGVSNEDGDGSTPNLSTERCLDTTRHAVFLALWPSLSEEITETIKRTDVILPEIQISIAQFDVAGVRDPEYRRQALADAEQLHMLKEKVESALRSMLVKLDHLRRTRKIASNLDVIQQRLLDLRLQIREFMDRVRWRQDSLGGDLPLIPENPSGLVVEDTDLTSDDFAKRLASINTDIVVDVDTPYIPLSQSLETPLKEHFSRKFASLRGLATACEDMLGMLVALQHQASAMVTARKACRALQLQIEDAKNRSTTIIDSISTPGDRDKVLGAVARFNLEVDHFQLDVQSFNDGLVCNIPFVARQPPPKSLSSTRWRSLSLNLNGPLPLPPGHEIYFDLLSVDAAVRTDCNSFTMKLGGDMEGLLKCKHHLALACLSYDLDVELVHTAAEIDHVIQNLNSWKVQRDQFTKDGSYLDSLNKLLEGVDEHTMIRRKTILQRFSPHREQLRRMETLSTTLNQPIREVFYMARVRGVDDLELRFNTWSENLASLKRDIDQAIRNELFRLDEVKREERRQREEAQRRKAEEEAEKREKEEKRLREETEKEEAMRLAEERRIRQDMQRLEKIEAERQRLQQERVEAEKRMLAEKQEAVAERLRLERQYSATMEAQRLQAQRERDELASRLRQLEEELTSTRRLQQDQQKSSAEQTAKTVSDLERQRRDLEDLLREYRDKLDALKTLESQAQQAQQVYSQASKEQVSDQHSRDVFTLEVSPNTPTSRSRAMMTMEARIHVLRRRLSSLALRDASNSSHNLPTKDLAENLRHELTSVVGEVETYPANVDDAATNVVLRSLRVELNTALGQMQHLDTLAELNSSFQSCDAVLSDLLEHIDSYPAPPPIPVSSFSDPQLVTPEDQLSARVMFTKGIIDSTHQLARPLLSDYRVAAEHSRTMQTWNDLADMANDRICRKSRPNSVISSRETSGRSSVTSVRTMDSTSTNRSSTHSKKASYSGLSVGSKPPRFQPGGLLAPPQPTPTQRRVKSGGSEATPRASSRMSSDSLRSTSGSFGTSLYQPTFASRQRTTSLSSTNNSTVPTLTKRSSHNPLRTKVQAGQSSQRITRPTSPMSEASSSRSAMRSSRPSRPSGSSGSTWARAPRSSLSSILPPRAGTPQKRERPPPREKYIPNPKSKLDVAVGDVVNNLPVGISIEGLTETWKDQSGKYWIGNQDPKLCFCRILPSQTVMVRVGGGWQELSKFIKDHFADSFRLLPESPPRAGGPDDKWISSATLLEAAEITSADTTAVKSSPPLLPRTPEPKLPFVPSFSLLTPNGQSPRSICSSPSTKGSPLTPLQFIRRAEPDSAPLRPVTPTKQARGNSGYIPPLRLWRP